MKIRPVIWCWLLRLVATREVLDSRERLAPVVIKSSAADLGKRAVADEFNTLDEDIETVKKLKVMVQVFERIKKENPIAYERMVRFFEENEKAHRIRRSFLQELKTFGRKRKVEALENKLDSSVKCHPKSGRELIHMFVRGLNDLYPDMTKLLMKELEGAMETKNFGKPSSPKRITLKQVEKKTTAATKDETKKIHKYRGSTEGIMSTVKCCPSKCTKTTINCPSTCSTTSTPPCTSEETTANCEQKCAEVHREQDIEEAAGDMRIHPTAKSHKTPEGIIPKPKSKEPQNDNITLTAPFKDFQVQGSIMFSNPNKPVGKRTHQNTSSSTTAQNSTAAANSRVDKARFVDNWRGWYPLSERSDGLVDFGQQELKSCEPQLGHNHARISRGNGDYKLEPRSLGHTSYPDQAKPQSQWLNEPIPELSKLASRNKRRSMYVLYE